MSELPPWFVLQDPPKVEIGIEDWKTLGMERVELLKEVQHDIKYAVQRYYDRSALYNSTIILNYIKGHLFLRLVSANSYKLKSWIIEAEGDLFAHLFRSLAAEEQKTIAKNLFGAINFLTLTRLKSKLLLEDDYEEQKMHFMMYNNPSEVWCVRFSHVPELIAKRRGFLFKGWLILKKEEFYRSLKIAFENKLKEEIELLQGKVGIDETIDSAIKELERSLDGVIQVKSFDIDIDAKKLGGKLLHEQIEAFPPCIRFLYLDLETKGYLPHNQRLQLGWFLKKVGMDVDTQMHYWYEKSVDNIGLSYEQFVKRIGYQIRHIYGLEGAKVDYNVPKCSTCQSDYFCFFSHLAPEVQESLIKKLYSLNQEQLTGLMRESLQNKYSKACNTLFRQAYHLNANFVHPVQWTRRIINSGTLGKLRTRKESEEPAINGDQEEKREK
ncbi:MAG: hypothetical protein ACFFD4_14685 [Candidatus Odinarchaeota archaeon]